MIPTGRLVALFLLPLAVGLFASAWPLLAGMAIVLDLLIVVLAGIDLALDRGAVEAERDLPTIESVGQAFDVRLGITNSGTGALRLQLTDDAPGQVEGLPIAVELGSGESASLDYTLRIERRGTHRFGRLSVRWESPMGLWRKQRDLEPGGRDEITIYPNFRQLRSWGLLTRHDEQHVPVRVRRRLGGENEFRRLRPYVSGDSIRHVDWRATARRRELITREYGQERNQNVLFLLDAGRTMTGRAGSMEVFDHALNASLAMGQVALRHGDRVGVLAFDQAVRVWLPPKGGARSGARLIRGLYDVFPSRKESDYTAALTWLSSRVRRRSLVVLVTSMIDEVNASLAEALTKSLGRRHLVVCAVLRDPDVEHLLTAEPVGGEAPFVAGAAAEILLWREGVLRRMRERGALVLDVEPDKLTPALLSRYLEVKARRLL